MAVDVVNNDVPYLEPLLFWLQDDPVLKLEFTDKSFFMPQSDIATSVEEALKNKGCPPKAIWITPQDTMAQSTRPGCLSPGVHTFYITLIVPCYRDQFMIKRVGDEAKLEGQFMQLSAIRKYIKKTVNAFYQDAVKKGEKRFADMVWIKDVMMYPQDDAGLLMTGLEYRVTIF